MEDKVGRKREEGRGSEKRAAGVMYAAAALEGRDHHRTHGRWALALLLHSPTLYFAFNRRLPRVILSFGSHFFSLARLLVCLFARLLSTLSLCPINCVLFDQQTYRYPNIHRPQCPCPPYRPSIPMINFLDDAALSLPCSGLGQGPSGYTIQSLASWQVRRPVTNPFFPSSARLKHKHSPPIARVHMACFPASYVSLLSPRHGKEKRPVFTGQPSSSIMA